MASKKFTQFDTANNTPETEISVGVKGTDNFKRLNYLTATTNPTVNDDNSDGYTVGSMWFNASTGTMYICTDSTVGAAKWSNGLGYQRLTFNVTQSGTDAPVVDVLINEVGFTLTENYDSEGEYSLSLGATIDNTKTQIFGGLVIAGECGADVQATLIRIVTSSSGVSADDILNDTAFEVRFYPGWDA